MAQNLIRAAKSLSAVWVAGPPALLKLPLRGGGWCALLHLKPDPLLNRPVGAGRTLRRFHRRGVVAGAERRWQGGQPVKKK